MSDDLTRLRNIGPAMERAMHAVGITSVAQLRALGTDGAYAKMIATGTRPHFITYYVIEMALQGRPWNDCKGVEKADLRQRFDALKSEHVDAGVTALEYDLDRIGTGLRR